MPNHVNASTPTRCAGPYATGCSEPGGTGNGWGMADRRQLPRIKLLDEFKEFALRGSMVDLAVGVVIGAAFNAVVQSFANDVLLNLVAAVFGQPDFSDLTWNLNGAAIGYGAFITASINFLLTSLGVFVVVRFLNRLRRPADPGVPEPPTTRTCPFCLTVLPREATRCSACTSHLDDEDAARMSPEAAG